MGVLQLQIQILPMPVASTSSPSTITTATFPRPLPNGTRVPGIGICGRRKRDGVVFVGNKEEMEVATAEDGQQEDDEEPTSVDLEYVSQIQRVLELLKQNRDMLFSEVRLTIMIEDPREVERRRLLGIEDRDAPTREDLVAALDDVNEGRIPENRVALQMLAEEMMQWPNLEVEASKKKHGKSLYAKATDTGVNPKEAAKRLNIDWDSAAEIEEAGDDGETKVPPAVV